MSALEAVMLSLSLANLALLVLVFVTSRFLRVVRRREVLSSLADAGWHYGEMWAGTGERTSEAKRRHALAAAAQLDVALHGKRAFSDKALAIAIEAQCARVNKGRP